MGFLSKIRNNMRKRVSRMPRRRGGFLRGMPMMKPNMGDMRFRGRIPSFNPTIFGQPIGDMDFSQMPKISPEDIMNLQVPTEAPVMPMTQDLPEVSPVGMLAGRTLQQDYSAEPRMMMQAGDEVSPEQELFSLQAQLKNLEEQLRLDRSYNDDQAVINTSAEMSAIQKRIQEILQESGRTISDMDRQMGFKAAGSIGLDDKGNPVFPGYAEGGEAFPDLSGDGETTFKDVLIGRGVDLKAEGGEMMTQENEIDAMLGGMDSEEAGAMEDLEQMAPEMEMIDQLVTMVVQMIQQGASEEEVMMFLREQGLDDEDIGTVLQLVAEMAEAEAMPQDGIDAELAQIS